MVVSAEEWRDRHRKITIFYTSQKWAAIGRYWPPFGRYPVNERLDELSRRPTPGFLYGAAETMISWYGRPLPMFSIQGRRGILKLT